MYRITESDADIINGGRASRCRVRNVIGAAGDDATLGRLSERVRQSGIAGRLQSSLWIYGLPVIAQRTTRSLGALKGRSNPRRRDGLIFRVIEPCAHLTKGPGEICISKAALRGLASRFKQLHVKPP
jgi:hypothetical protein